MSVGSKLRGVFADLLLSADSHAIEERFKRCSTAAHLALVRPLLVVAQDPAIEILLKLFERSVELLSEGDLIELLQDRLVEALADPVRLRMLHLRARVIDVVEGEEQLVGMLVMA